MPLDEQSYLAARQRIHIANLLAQDIALAATGLEKTAQYVDGCCLASTVLAQKSQDASTGYAKRKIVVYQSLAIIVRQVAALNYIFHCYTNLLFDE
jgi:hypothetical protein